MKRQNKTSEPDAGVIIAPVLEEVPLVGKRAVDTAITKVSIKVKEKEQVVEQPLLKQSVEVRHVMINRFINAPVETRTEGEVTIIPVMEEVLVVEKKLRLKEEVHIRRRSETLTHSQKEKLREEEAVVEQTDLRHLNNDVRPNKRRRHS